MFGTADPRKCTKTSLRQCVTNRVRSFPLAKNRKTSFEELTILLSRTLGSEVSNGGRDQARLPHNGEEDVGTPASTALLNTRPATPLRKRRPFRRISDANNATEAIAVFAAFAACGAICRSLLISMLRTYASTLAGSSQAEVEVSDDRSGD